MAKKSKPTKIIQQEHIVIVQKDGFTYITISDDLLYKNAKKVHVNVKVDKHQEILRLTITKDK